MRCGVVRYDLISGREEWRSPRGGCDKCDGQLCVLLESSPTPAAQAGAPSGMGQQVRRWDVLAGRRQRPGGVQDVQVRLCQGGHLGGSHRPDTDEGSPC